MSDPYGPWGTVDEPEPPRRNRGVYVAAVAAVAVLAVVGGVAGYILAGNEGKQAVADPDSRPTATASAPPETAVPAPSTGAASPPGPSPRADTFALPNVAERDFEQARRQLRDLRLGVTVIFRSTGDDRRVERTEPAAGQLVHPGTSVKLYVRGRPPVATVPGVVGLACDEAGRLVAEHGLAPQYPTGRAGRVLRQDPEPPTDTVRWNDPVRLYCGTASPTPSPTAG